MEKRTLLKINISYFMASKTEVRTCVLKGVLNWQVRFTSRGGGYILHMKNTLYQKVMKDRDKYKSESVNTERWEQHKIKALLRHLASISYSKHTVQQHPCVQDTTAHSVYM